MSEPKEKRPLSAKKMQWMLIGLGVVAIPFVLYAISAARYYSKCSVPRASCLEHRNDGCTLDGEYNIAVGGRELTATCDMHSGGGGWTLVANYMHRAGVTDHAAPNPLTDRFPIQNHTTLGASEEGSSAWGHTGTGILSQLPFKEIRFRCQTTAHNRLVDFSLPDPLCMNYFRTGKGYCIQDERDRPRLVQTARPLDGHSGFLPNIAVKGWRDQGENALTNYPFFFDWHNHWSVGAVSKRFECDDYQSTDTNNTWHQVWVR